jgi:hypothetical protein
MKHAEEPVFGLNAPRNYSRGGVFDLMKSPPGRRPSKAK